MERVTCDRRDRGAICGDAAHHLEPVCPARPFVPPGGHDSAVGGRREEVEVIGITAHDVDCGAGANLQITDGEPRMPAAPRIPPATVDTIVSADGEKVEMSREAVDCRDGRSGPAPRGNTAFQ